jgi:hypothetical protein
MEVHPSLHNLFNIACDSYLDATSCKEYTSAIFTHVSFDEEEVTAYDSRQDDQSFSNMRCDDSEESDWEEVAEKTSLSAFLLPALLPALTYLAQVDLQKPFQADTKTAALDRSAIFRNTSTDMKIHDKKETSTSEYSEFCKLCRCTAWSQDTEDTNLSLASNIGINPGPYQVSLIHWNAVINESVEDREGEILDQNLERPLSVIVF